MLAAEKFRPLAAASAARWGATLGTAVPVDLVLGIIQRESSGNPAAIRTEPDGRVSRGLMQVLEGTARDLGLSDPTQLHVPSVGIDVGTHYLAKKLAENGGNAARAAAAYNAGSVRFNSSEQFVNQGYVDAVLGFARRFASSAQQLITSPAGRLGGIFVVGLALSALCAAMRRRGAVAR